MLYIITLLFIIAILLTGLFTNTKLSDLLTFKYLTYCIIGILIIPGAVLWAFALADYQPKIIQDIAQIGLGMFCLGLGFQGIAILLSSFGLLHKEEEKNNES